MHNEALCWCTVVHADGSVTCEQLADVLTKQAADMNAGRMPQRAIVSVYRSGLRAQEQMSVAKKIIREVRNG